MKSKIVVNVDKKLPKLKKKLEDMSNDDMMHYGWEVMDKHMHLVGDPIDVRKLPSDYDDSELNYDVDTIHNPKKDKK